MNNVGRRAVLGLTLAIASMAVWAGPVAAVDAADYLVWRFAAPGARGVGLIKTGPGTLQLEVIGLAANKNHTLKLSTAGCAKQATNANTVSATSFTSDANGAKAYKVELENAMVSSIKSARLFKGSSQLDCAQANSYQISGNGPMESLSINFFDRNGLHFAVMIEVENDETHWVGHDFLASEEYTLVATNAKCPNPPSIIRLEDVLLSSVKGTVYEDSDNDVAPGAIKSFQVFHGANRVACVKAINLSVATQ